MPCLWLSRTLFSALSHSNILRYDSSHLSDPSYRETYESSHSVVLAIFASHADHHAAGQENMSSSDVRAPGQGPRFTERLVPFYTHCLIEVRAAVIDAKIGALTVYLRRTLLTAGSTHRSCGLRSRRWCGALARALTARIRLGISRTRGTRLRGIVWMRFWMPFTNFPPLTPLLQTRGCIGCNLLLFQWCLRFR